MSGISSWFTAWVMGGNLGFPEYPDLPPIDGESFEKTKGTMGSYKWVISDQGQLEGGSSLHQQHMWKMMAQFTIMDPQH